MGGAGGCQVSGVSEPLAAEQEACGELVCLWPATDPELSRVLQKLYAPKLFSLFSEVSAHFKTLTKFM